LPLLGVVFRVKIIVKEITSWNEYQAIWKTCVKSVPWGKEERFMFYNKEEEFIELKEQFKQGENLFLAALSEGTDEKKEILGCLGFLIRNSQAQIRRWEPFVKKRSSFNAIARKLLEDGIMLLKRRGIKTLGTSFKYELNDPHNVPPLLELFTSTGFKDKIPPAQQFIKKLIRKKTIHKDYESKDYITIKTRADHSLEEFCDLTLQAFTTTDEDQKIHSWDPFVSNFNRCLELNRRIAAEKLGYSPHDFWLVAHIKNQPAGLLVAFAPQRKNHLKVGVIGVLGVLPEFRGKGVARVLITTIERAFLQKGYNYSFVATPKTNLKAITLYERLNYTPFQQFVSLQKQLE